MSVNTLIQVILDAVSMLALIILVGDRLIAPHLPSKQREIVDHLARIAQAVEDAVPQITPTQKLPTVPPRVTLQSTSPAQKNGPTT